MDISVRQNVNLKPLTTFRIGGQAKFFFKPKNKKQVIKGFNWAKEKDLNIFLLGGGSNILVSDKGFNGLVLKLGLNKIKKVFEDKNKVRLEVGGGVLLPQLLSFCLNNDLRGMIWSVGIPGTLGGAIFGNAGAHNKSIGDFVLRVEVLSNGKVKKIKASDKFSYRNSFFKKNDFIILKALLEFKKGITKENKKNFKKWRKRRTDLPSSMTAGCVFENVPFKNFSKKIIKKYSDFDNFGEKVPTGWLIEKSGLKGKTIGEAMVSKRHANFILNTGQAKSEDVKELIDLIKTKVKDKFGVLLKEEIQYIGDN